MRKVSWGEGLGCTAAIGLMSTFAACIRPRDFRVLNDQSCCSILVQFEKQPADSIVDLLSHSLELRKENIHLHRTERNNN